MGIHDGHRERLKAQFREKGLDGMTEYRALELLLFYAIPMADVYPVSKALIDRFGSLSSVLAATVDELCSVPGVGANTATLIKLVPQITKKYLVSTASGILRINTPANAGVYLMPFYFGAKVEKAHVLLLDAEGFIIDLKLIAAGDEGSVMIDPEAIAEAAYKAGADRVVLAHNHLSDIALSSTSDVETTGRVRAALEARGIRLWDHVIISKNDFVSMRDSGML